MTNLDGSSFIQFRGAYLYLDDVRKLLAIFEENFDKVELIIDGHRFTDLSNVTDLNKPHVTKLTIKGEPDYHKNDYKTGEMSLTLVTSEGGLYISDAENIFLLGIASQIKEIINKRKYPLRFFDNFWMSAFLLVITYILDALFMIVFHLSGYFYYPLIIGSTLWYQITTLYFKERFRIYLFEFNSRTNFFVRDLSVRILVGLIVAFAVGSIIFIIEHLINLKPFY